MADYMVRRGYIESRLGWTDFGWRVDLAVLVSRTEEDAGDHWGRVVVVPQVVAAWGGFGRPPEGPPQGPDGPKDGRPWGDRRDDRR